MACTRLCVICGDGGAKTVERAGAGVYYSCAACGVTFLEPDQRLSAEEERKRYGLHRNRPDDKGYRRFLETLADPLIPMLKPGARGLDYGCGPVPVLATMLRAAGHPTAVYDPFFFADSAPLETTYDFVTCTEAAEHFYRPIEEFQTLDRLLVPGGILAVMTTFRTDTVDFSTWHYRRDPTHVIFYREETMHCLAGRFGWTCMVPALNVAIMKKPLSPF
ncbi:class I SAM-dependent methyltransferase [Desulfatiferula olefinivorans]